MKTYALLIIAVMLHLSASAQKFNSYFLKNNGKEVSTKDSADFIRIVYEADTTTGLYPVKEYYLNGRPKSLGMSTKVNPPNYHSVYRSFYPNGSRKMVCTYVNGRIKGEAYTYYPNGQLYTSVNHILPDGFTPYVPPMILTVNDSTGKNLIIKGNGHYIEYDDDFKFVVAEGELKDGAREGVWTGKDPHIQNIEYKENYVNGRLISGESKGKDGTVKTYKNAETLPEFRGGIENFYYYLRRSMKYPQNAQKLNMEGKVIVRFVVERDGTLTEVEPVKRTHPEMDAEAIRIIKQSPKWIPATMKGQNVRVRYNIPVSFSMNR